MSDYLTNIQGGGTSLKNLANLPTAINTIAGGLQPEIIVTTDGTSCWAIKDGVRVDSIKSGNNFIITLPSIGTWTVTVSNGSKTRLSSISVIKVARYSTSIFVDVSWSTGTDAQIAAMVDALDKGDITIAETGWKVGDIRDVSLSAFQTYSETTYSTTTQAAQTAQLVIMNIGGKTFNGNGNSLDGKECHFVVGFKDNVCKSYWASYSNVYADSLIKTVENNIYNALPSAIKPIFKKFDVVTSTYNQTEAGGPNAISQQYFASLAEKEIFGSRTWSRINEANALSQFEWYKTEANRNHTNLSDTWWERSPLCTTVSTDQNACSVDLDGSSDFGRVDRGLHGLSPFGCI